MGRDWTRREMLKALGIGGLTTGLRPKLLEGASRSQPMMTRPIPGTGEELPVVGLGTWQQFDVELEADGGGELARVLRLLVEQG